MNRIEFELRGEVITLDALLKATAIAPSGGAAKAMVAQGRVEVDGRPELRKSCQLRAGQVVVVGGARISLLPPPGSITASEDTPHRHEPRPDDPDPAR